MTGSAWDLVEYLVSVVTPSDQKRRKIVGIRAARLRANMLDY